MSVGSVPALAVVLGSLLATGILLMATRIPRWSAPTLSRRIAPYLRDIADPLGLTPLHPLPTPRSGIGLRGAGALSRVIEGLGGAETTRRRLVQAGWSPSVARYRARQLAAGIAGLALGATAAVGLALAGQGTTATILLPAVSAGAAVALMHVSLTIAAKRRARRIRDDVPIVLEFLALCLAAGESLIDALARVGEVGAGELTGQVRSAVLAARTGSPLAEALRELARTVDVASVTRAVDHLIAAIDRGAPLAQVLQAQAADAREDAKTALIEQAGRKEILMLLPLVFLVLPLSVLFAVFPGIVMLRLGL